MKTASKYLYPLSAFACVNILPILETKPKCFNVAAQTCAKEELIVCLNAKV